MNAKVHAMPQSCPHRKCGGVLVAAPTEPLMSTNKWLGIVEWDWRLMDATEALERDGGPFVRCSKCDELFHVHRPKA